MNTQDKNLLIETLKPSNEEIHKKILDLLTKLKTKGKLYINDYFIFILRSPELPILIAHMDIFHNRPTLKEKYILTNDYYVWSPLGVGGDDRCGVFALLKLSELNVNLLFTHYEERGGIGASEFINSEIAKELDPCYLIELDRRGNKEWVCYNYDDENLEWKTKLNKYFTLKVGSFSDITILGSYWKVCSANLSIGFFNEHSISEYIDLTILERNIKIIPRLIEELGNQKYPLPKNLDKRPGIKNKYIYEDLDLDYYRFKDYRKKLKRYWLYSDYEEIEDLYYYNEFFDKID